MKKVIMGWAVVALLASCTADLGLGPNGGQTTDVGSRAADPVVKLEKASSQFSAHYGIPAVSRLFYIKVKNLTYEKQVFVHHSRTDGTWADYPATYLKAADSGYEIWYAAVSWNAYSGGSSNPYGDQFVLKYQVAGQTYWDNNGGQNYTLAQNGGDLLGPGVHVYGNGGYAYLSSGTNSIQFYGSLDLRNLAYAKTVTIVYTTDHWATTHTTPGTYNSYVVVPYGQTIPSPNAYGTELWTWSVDTGVSVGQVEYALAYQVNGQTYWDNNYGRNYVVTLN